MPGGAAAAVPGGPARPRGQAPTGTLQWRTLVPRILSGVQPTGNTHLGNYVGAFRQWVEQQHDFDSFFPIVDLHAVTLPYDPAELRARTLEMAAMLLAAGLDPRVCTVFVQSHVPEHTELAWMFNNIVTVGELRRMTQFKAKAAQRTEGAVPAGYFNYPVLQAADLLAPGALHPQGRRPGDGPAAARREDVEVGRLPGRPRPPARPARHDPQEGALGRHRLRPRGGGPPRQASDHEPARAVLDRVRPLGRRARAAVRRPRLRGLQGRPGRGTGRLARAGPRALRGAARRPGAPRRRP